MRGSGWAAQASHGGTAQTGQGSPSAALSPLPASIQIPRPAGTVTAHHPASWLALESAAAMADPHEEWQNEQHRKGKGGWLAP